MTKSFKCKSCCQFDPSEFSNLQKLAIKRGGKLLSTKYEGDKVNLLWQCSENHDPWEATPNNIKSKNSWCPICISPDNENRCMVILNKLLDAKLTKVRPEFLRYPSTDKCLELDGFDEKLNIAFEYNGIQHYETMYYDKDSKHDGDSDIDEETEVPKDRLTHQMEKDQFKADICNQLGIKLLVIPYWEVKGKKDIDVVNYIIELVSSSGIHLTEEIKADTRNLNITEYMPNTSKSAKYEKEIIELLAYRRAKFTKINKDDKISTNRTPFMVQCRFIEHSSVQKTYENLMDKRIRWCDKCTVTYAIAKAYKMNALLVNKYIYISEIDRFGKCLIRCACEKVLKDDVDLDDTPNFINKCNRCNQDPAKIANYRIEKIVREKEIEEAKKKYYFRLYLQGEANRCSKCEELTHLRNLNENNICKDCIDIERRTKEKSKYCPHGKRIRSDVAPCPKCSDLAK
jgi:hypothetical protein